MGDMSISGGYRPYGYDPPPPLPATGPAFSPTAAGISSADTPEGRRALAASLVKSGKGAAPEDVAVVQQYMVDHLPASTMRLMQEEGLHVEVTRGSVATDRPDLAGVQPRGYAADGDWSKVVGTYDVGHRNVIIATQDGPNGTRRMPDNRDSGSVDALMHETGHGVNYRDSIWRNVSNSDSFKAAYDQDSHTGRLAQPYYHQDNDGQAGRDEAFAESFAMYTKDPAAMQRDYPHLYAFFQNFMQSHGVGAQ